jgi:hypothetical protein
MAKPGPCPGPAHRHAACLSDARAGGRTPTPGGLLRVARRTLTVVQPPRERWSGPARHRAGPAAPIRSRVGRAGLSEERAVQVPLQAGKEALSPAGLAGGTVRRGPAGDRPGADIATICAGGRRR